MHFIVIFQQFSPFFSLKLPHKMRFRLFKTRKIYAISILGPYATVGR